MPRALSLKHHKGGEYVPMRTQEAFHRSRARFRSYIGFIGSGKSLAGAVEAFLTAVDEPGYRPGKTLVCREVFSDLKDTTWETLSGVIKETCPDLIRDEKASNHELRLILKNGWEFIGKHLGRWQTFGSMEVDYVWIDECNDDGIDLKVYSMLTGRIGRGRYGNRLWCTGNPAGRNWNYDLYFKHRFEGGRPRRDHAGFQPTREEMVHLPDDYWDSLREFWPESFIQRMLDGDFDAFEGQILTEMDPETHYIDPFTVPMEWPRYRGLDHGLDHPTACVWVAVDYDGNHFVYREHVKSDAVPQTNAERILALSEPEEERIQWTAIDPATQQRGTAGGQMARIVDQYREAGLICRLADNDIKASIARLKLLLQTDDKHLFPRWHFRAGEYGAPRLYVTRDCRVTWHQMQNWKWKAVKPGEQQRAKVVSRDDDTVAALRYCLMEMPRAPEPVRQDPLARFKALLGEIEEDVALENRRDLIGA